MGARWHVPLVVAAVAAPLLLGGCGGLTTPDPSTGEIVGRLAGVANPGAASVYVLGSPDVRSAVAADGSYRLERVPVGPAKLVFYDGGERAEVVSAGDVAGARRRSVDRSADGMPRASRVVVLARAAAGARSSRSRVTLEGTVLRDLPTDDRGTVTLFPVPEGEWTVLATLAGFRASRVALSLSSGVDAPLDLPLDDIEEESSERGCVSATCSDGLRCDEHDGRCYACASSADCGAGFSCDDHVCIAAGAAQRDACEPCTASEQCGALGLCLPAGSGASGLCATEPSSGGCDAGYALSVLSGRTVCVPPAYSPSSPSSIKNACEKLLTTFNASCLKDDSCRQFLAGGECVKPEGASSGVCTASCARDSDCPKEVGLERCSAGICARR